MLFRIGLLTLTVGGALLGSSLNFDGYTFTSNGANLDGTSLQIMNNQSSTYSAAFITAPYILDPQTSFVTTFDFKISNNGLQTLNEFDPYEGNGGGFAFVVHNCFDANYTGGGNCAQIRAAFNADEGNPQSTNDLTIPYGQAQIQENGGGGPYSPQQNFNLHSSLSRGGLGPFDTPANSTGVYDLVTGHVRATYDSTTGLFGLMATSNVGGNVNFSMPFNLFGDLDTNGNVNQPPPYGFFGFVANTNTSGRSQIEISNLGIQTVEGALPTAGVPEPGAMGLLAIGLGGLCWLGRQKRLRTSQTK